MADISKLLELVELVGRKMRRHFQPIVESEGLSVPELFVLRKIHNLVKCRVTELAEDIGIAPSTLTGITDRLVGKGFVNRGPDPDDRRAILLGAGEKLPALMERMQRARMEKMAGVFSALPPAELDRLVEDLETLLEGLEHEEEQ